MFTFKDCTENNHHGIHLERASDSAIDL